MNHLRKIYIFHVCEVVVGGGEGWWLVVVCVWGGG